MKRFWRAFLCFTAVCMLFVSLYGCQSTESGDDSAKHTQSDSESDSSVPVTDFSESMPDTQDPQNQKVLADYIVPLKEETYDHYVDSTGNEYSVSYSIPDLLLTSEDAQEVEKEYQSYCLKRLEAAQEAIKNESSLVCIGISYEAWIYEDTLTLMIQDISDWGFSTYFAYTFRISDGELLEDDEMALRFDITEDALESAVRNALNEQYKNLYGSGSTSNEYYQTQLDKTLSEENIDDVSYYLSQEGDLMVLATIYSLAGADAYQYPVPITLP